MERGGLGSRGCPTMFGTSVLVESVPNAKQTACKTGVVQTVVGECVRMSAQSNYPCLRLVRATILEIDS